MARPGRTQNETSDHAAQYIDAIVKISRRYGKGGSVPARSYKRAVRQVQGAFKGVRRMEAGR